MKYEFAVGQQVVSDDTPMASPPYRLRTHDRTALVAAKLAKPGEPCTKLTTHCIVGVIVKALILPKRIDARRHIAIPTPQAAERRNVLIPDLE